MKTRMIRSFARWATSYGLRRNHLSPHAPIDGAMYEPYGPEFEVVCNTDPANVWTVLDEPTRTGRLVIVSGKRHVNRQGYLITETAWVGPGDAELRY